MKTTRRKPLKAAFCATAVGLVLGAAASTAIASTGTTRGTISRIESNASGLVVTGTMRPDTPECSGTPGQFAMERTAPNFASVERMLLAAHLTGRSVFFHLHGCGMPGSGGNRHIIRNVYLD